MAIDVPANATTTSSTRRRRRLREPRDSLEKLRLDDASFTCEPRTSAADGFRCAFLGSLQMEIVREGLDREFGLDLIATAPSVSYVITLTSGATSEIASPAAYQHRTRSPRSPSRCCASR